MKTHLIKGKSLVEGTTIINNKKRGRETMYRIMMPNGRLVETSEVIFARDRDGTVDTCHIADANAIVFKTTNEDVWEIYNLNAPGAHGATVGNIWNGLLTRGYFGFSKYQVNSDVKVSWLDEDFYYVLQDKMADIGDMSQD